MNYLISGPVTPQIVLHFIEKMSEMTGSGGHSVFLGQVRADKVNGKTVKAIEYSAYEEMVNSEAEKIKAIVFSEFDDVRSIDIVHSKDIVKAGEISLFVLVSAGHRQQAMTACTKTVELIKQNLPVWKKELYDDDSSSWKQNDQELPGS